MVQFRFALQNDSVAAVNTETSVVIAGSDGRVCCSLSISDVSEDTWYKFCVFLKPKGSVPRAIRDGMSWEGLQAHWAGDGVSIIFLQSSLPFCFKELL